jgi:arylsulfatase A-like enzyme/Tfp pilus assembly protein PilF
MKKIILSVIVVIVIGMGIWFSLHKRKANAVFPDANILLITIDTVRPDYLSCYGSSNRTPNLDQIANSSILFENAFSQVPLTFPSHTSILTGLFPVHHSVHQNGLEIFAKPDSLITTTLQAHGYKTGAVVSSFVLDRKFGLARNFDIYDDQMERLPTISTNFEVERSGKETLGAAEKILKQWKGQKWFLWIHFYDPHAPYNPPSPRTGYAGEIQFVDDQIGNLMSWLKENQLRERLIIGITGDHGESLGEHGEKTHGFFVYNSTLKIPMMLSFPGVSPKHVSAAAATVDLTPTLLELAGIPDSQKRDGQSLLMDSQKNRDIYFESRYPELLGWNGLQGIIRGNWKLISTTRSELYDWEKDQRETQNMFSAKQEISGPMKNDLARLAPAGETSPAVTDAETLEKLKSLGYVGSGNLSKPNRTADPKDKIALWSKYEVSLATGDKQPILEKLVSQEPVNNFFRLALANAYREKKDWNGTVAQLKEAIRNDSSDANSYHELAVTYREMKNYPEGLRAEDAAITLQPSRTEFHGVRGMILVETGRFEMAKAEFNQVIEKDPNNGIAWNNLGNAYRETNELEQAAQAYKKSIELAPHYAYPQNGLGTILVRQGRTREAIPYFEKALELDPKFVEVYLNMGIAFHSLNEIAKARTLYETFLKIAPDSMEAEKRNARLLLSQIH